MTGEQWLQPVWSQRPIQEVGRDPVNPQLTSKRSTDLTLELAQAHEKSHAEETYLNGILTMH